MLASDRTFARGSPAPTVSRSRDPARATTEPILTLSSIETSAECSAERYHTLCAKISQACGCAHRPTRAITRHARMRIAWLLQRRCAPRPPAQRCVDAPPLPCAMVSAMLVLCEEGQRDDRAPRQICRSRTYSHAMQLSVAACSGPRQHTVAHSISECSRSKSLTSRS